MPVKDGFAALLEICDHPGFSRVPVVALTAKAIPGPDRILAAGFDAYAIKSIDMNKSENAWMSVALIPKQENTYERSGKQA